MVVAIGVAAGVEIPICVTGAATIGTGSGDAVKKPKGSNQLAVEDSRDACCKAGAAVYVVVGILGVPTMAEEITEPPETAGKAGVFTIMTELPIPAATLGTEVPLCMDAVESVRCVLPGTS